MGGASGLLHQRGSRSAGFRAFVLAVVVPWGGIALGHHSVISIYDDLQRFTAAVEVRRFELVDPHPLILVEILRIPGGQQIDGLAVGQTWTLEMDNARELRALGFDRDTFLPGDRLVVAVDPSRHTRYRENTLYVRGIEHEREGFIYIHNLRELIPIRSRQDSLGEHLHRVR